MNEERKEKVNDNENFTLEFNLNSNFKEQNKKSCLKKLRDCFFSLLNCLKTKKIKSEVSESNENSGDIYSETNHRSRIYSSMIESFCSDFKKSGSIRNYLKIIFFILISIILIAVSVLFIFAVYKAYALINNPNIKVKAISVAISSIVASLCSVLVAFIKLPEIIAKYLFDPQEEKYRIRLITEINELDKVALNQSYQKELTGMTKGLTIDSTKEEKNVGVAGTSDSDIDSTNSEAQNGGMPVPEDDNPVQIPCI